MLKRIFAKTVASFADTGSVAAVCVALFAVAVGVIEFFGPGMAASAVAPQTLALAAVASCAAALTVNTAPRASWPARIAHALIGAAITAFAWWAAQYYFASLPQRTWLTAAVVTLTALLFLTSAVKTPEEV